MTIQNSGSAPAVSKSSRIINEQLSCRYPDGSALLVMVDGSLVLVEAVAPYQVRGDADAPLNAW